MSAITELADRLGKAIAESSQASSLRAAKNKLNDQPELKQLLTEFREHTTKIAQLQSEQKPIEVEDKHKLQELQTKLMADETFKTFTAAQVEYVDLMRQVNDSIRKHLAEVEKD